MIRSSRDNTFCYVLVFDTVTVSKTDRKGLNGKRKQIIIYLSSITSVLLT